MQPLSLLPSLHMEDFSYMTDSAVEYYLPGVLRLMMETPYDDTLWIYLHGFLRPRHTETLAARVRLTPSQRQAIAEWALYLYQQLRLLDPELIDPSEASALATAYR